MSNKIVVSDYDFPALFLGIVLLIIFFTGEPDIHDAIIHWLMATR